MYLVNMYVKPQFPVINQLRKSFIWLKMVNMNNEINI